MPRDFVSRFPQRQPDPAPNSPCHLFHLYSQWTMKGIRKHWQLLAIDFSCSLKDAFDVHRTLGYDDGDLWLPKANGMAPLDGPLWDRYEVCTGTESHIDQCKHKGYIEVHDQYCFFMKNEAGVNCTRLTQPGEHLKLICLCLKT